MNRSSFLGGDGRGAAKLGLTIKPNQITISRRENGETAPSQQHRTALAQIATKHGHEDLTEYFRAPLSARRLVGLMTDAQDQKY